MPLTSTPYCLCIEGEENLGDQCHRAKWSEDFQREEYLLLDVKWFMLLNISFLRLHVWMVILWEGGQILSSLGQSHGENKGTAIRYRAENKNSAGTKSWSQRSYSFLNNSQKFTRECQLLNNPDSSNKPYLALKELGDPSWVSFIKQFNRSMDRFVSTSSPLYPQPLLSLLSNWTCGAKTRFSSFPLCVNTAHPGLCFWPWRDCKISIGLQNISQRWACKNSERSENSLFRSFLPSNSSQESPFYSNCSHLHPSPPPHTHTCTHTLTHALLVH